MCIGSLCRAPTLHLHSLCWLLLLLLVGLTVAKVVLHISRCWLASATMMGEWLLQDLILLTTQ
jgi:hypothetical protein